jgi:transposase
LRGGVSAETQVRPNARVLDDSSRDRAVELFGSAAEGNAVVVQRLLAGEGQQASVRSVQRVLASTRRARRVAQVATVRYETAPGHQVQIDFGQKLVAIAGELVRVYLLVAVLGFSRRIFVKAFLAARQDDWLEGIADGFRHFGGVTRTALGDNDRCLVERRDRATGAVVFTPAYLAFCRDWDIVPRACAPYRARTKGKTESGVKYVKYNGLAGRAFESFGGLEGHLVEWMAEADERIHGTTHERPRERFEREERATLRPLPTRVLPVRQQRLRRRVANDAFVDVDTVRYSVPHGLVRDSVDVQVGEHEVQIHHGGVVVAVHARSHEPFKRVVDKAHFAGLWRRDDEPADERLAEFGRSLDVYAAIVEGGAR